jgi:hypothetical protein
MKRSWRRTIVRSSPRFAAPALAGMAALLTTTAASAEDANGFGEKSQLIVSVDRLMPAFSYTSQTLTTTQGGATLKATESGTSAAIFFGREPSLGVVHTLPRVAFDFTIVRHLTLGGAVAVAFGLGGTREEDFGNNNTRRSDAAKTSIIGLAPRVGYVIPLANTFAFWPRAGFAFYSVSTKSNAVGQGNIEVTTTNSDSLLSLDLDPQFVWTPIQHFFFHFGPIVNVPLSGSRSIEVANGATSNTTKNDLSVFHFGLTAGLGGWFDL